MGKQLIKPVLASWMADQLNLALLGEDRIISSVCGLDQLEPGALTFSKKNIDIESNDAVVIIGEPTLTCPVEDSKISVLHSKSPRFDFALALAFLEKEIGFKKNSEGPKVHPSAKIGKNVVLGNGVEIDEGTVLLNNIVIGDEVKIGKNCLIKSCAVIGEEGFGFEKDNNGTPVRIPHLGSVLIGNNVEVGSLTTICRGTLGNTILEDCVKIDDHVHIAHNCIIREKAFIIACAEISGGVEIGASTWIAPSVSILQKIKIGSKAFVGLGAVVLKDVPNEVTVVGNPAKVLNKNI